MGLFGGSSSKIRAIDTRTAEQKDVSKLFGPYFASRFGRRMAPFKGERVAGISGIEGQGLENLSGMLTADRAPLFGRAEAALTPGLEGAPSTEIRPELTEEFFRKSIYDPALKNLREDIIPEIESQFAGNFFSSARAGATSEAVGDFGEQQASILAELQYADEQARRGLAESAAGRQLTASGQAVGLGALEEQIGMGRIEASQTFGSLPRRLQQARLDAEFNEWIRTLPEYSPVIEQALRFLGTPGLSLAVSQGSQGIGGSLIGAAGMLGAAKLMPAPVIA